MSSLIKPYTTNQETWNTILQKNLRIPMNQREYSWETEEIHRFLDDIFHIFEEGKYVLKMGSIINLNYNNENHIYDGQQRILTTILIFNVIGCFSEKLKIKINPLLTIDTDIDELSSEQQKIKDECNVNLIPKIYCINPYDMKGLVYIFNDKIQSWMDYLQNIDNINSLDDLDNLNDYVSSSNKASTKKDFIRHIELKHSYKKPDESTKLYNAFIEIKNYFIIKKYNEYKLIDYLLLVHNDFQILSIILV